MTDQKNVNLYEAYASIYASQEEVEQLDEAREASHDPEGYEERQRNSQSSRQRRMNDPHTGINSPAFQAFMAQQMGGGKKKKKPANEEVETDLFDYILEHLVAEGYADTNEAALAIMANMSEEWRQSIAEELEQLDEISQKTATRAYAHGTSDEFEGLDDSKRVNRNMRLRDRIKKKFGEKAAQHADRAAHAQTFGRKGAGGMPPKP